MSIESIIKEYLTRYGVQDVQFNAKGMFSTLIDGIGLFSCEQAQDGIIVALFREISHSDTIDFMKRALQLCNPAENDNGCRPVLFESQAGMVLSIERNDISLSTLSTRVDALFRTLQTALRV